MDFLGLGFSNFTTLTPLFSLMVVWTLVWKGWALWIAAQKGSKKWFIALLIINTVGILEIVYIYVLSKKKKTISESEAKEDAEKVVTSEQTKTENPNPSDGQK